MLKPLSIAIGLILSSQVSFAGITPGVQYDGMSLQELESMSAYKGMPLAGKDDLANKRNQSMREAALSVGAQHGYIKEMNQLRNDFAREAQYLDGLFAFKDLMRLATPGEKSLYFLPAVIHESNEVTSSSADHSQIEVSGKYYEIIKKERLVTNPPDWREYLMIDLPVDASKPVGALLPKTPAEQDAWREWVAEGWEAGLLQANAEMTARARNLGSDYIGMIKYLSLVEEGKVVPSFVASQHQNKITQGSSLHLNQRTFAITAPAAFNDRHQSWIPLDLDPRAGYRTDDEIRFINGSDK
jgi:defect in organelle trafficking protein DotC